MKAIPLFVVNLFSTCAHCAFFVAVLWAAGGLCDSQGTPVPIKITPYPTGNLYYQSVEYVAGAEHPVLGGKASAFIYLHRNWLVLVAMALVAKCGLATVFYLDTPGAPKPMPKK